MLEADHRHFGETKQLRRFQPAVPRYDSVLPVDQNGRVEAERFNAVGDRADLLRECFRGLLGFERIEDKRHVIENGPSRRFAGTLFV